MSGIGNDGPLGHATGYPDTYDRAQLFTVARGPQRAAIGIAGGALPFTGADIWTAYELTWLDARGKPSIAIATLDVPADSPALVESKSMKLYLGAFAQSVFASADAAAGVIARDLTAATGADVRVSLRTPESFAAMHIPKPDPQINTPRSTSPAETFRPTCAAMSG